MNRQELTISLMVTTTHLHLITSISVSPWLMDELSHGNSRIRGHMSSIILASILLAHANKA